LSKRNAVFLVNLVQDVNILRPLVFMATRDFGHRALFLVSTKFTGRDLFGIWQAELEDICFQTGAGIEFYSDDRDAHRHLVGEGLIFAASESHLHNHVTTHSVFLHAPATYLKVTLQHGFECVGFRHSADHVRAHGATASFGADIVCSWYGLDQLGSIAQSQRSKVFVTGPTSVLQLPTASVDPTGDPTGLVCENLHSVRLNGAGNFKLEFVDAFTDFASRLGEDGREVVLRPHPGGQYVLKNKVALPENARINNAPMYRFDMRGFAYGISAPSSVLIDMLLARIPTAVWRDQSGAMDADHYAGLASVSTPQEWYDFSLAAIANPERFLEIQDKFLAGSTMPLTPSAVYERFAQLFKMAGRAEFRPAGFVPEKERILFVANAALPTLQVSFEKPLAPLVGRGEIITRLLTEQDLEAGTGPEGASSSDDERAIRALDEFQPTAIVFCRYSGPGWRSIIQWARRERVPTIYHIDDDLLAIPPDIGERKFAMHNSRDRLDVVRGLLASADLVYASTERLRRRVLEYVPGLNVIAGKIYCSGSVLRRAEDRRARTVGYMASADHAHNLDMVLPAIERLLERNPHVRFELFGSIPVPPALRAFEDRIQTSPAVANYANFLREFAERRWDVGICPLAPIDFNLMKANTKWVEYTSAGVAVVASRGTVYDDCCADGCGLLADSADEWLGSLERLIGDGEYRLSMVQKAQARLEREYSAGTLRRQVLDVLARAHKLAEARRELEDSKETTTC
jgi:glycosyltransferase involved in cell wall biosynthesis